MNWTVVRIRTDGSEETIATCSYGDDAEALFSNYVRDGLDAKVIFNGVFGCSVTHDSTIPEDVA